MNCEKDVEYPLCKCIAKVNDLELHERDSEMPMGLLAKGDVISLLEELEMALFEYYKMKEYDFIK